MPRRMGVMGGAWLVVALCGSACGAKSTPLEVRSDGGSSGMGAPSPSHASGSQTARDAGSQPPPCNSPDHLLFTEPGCSNDVQRTCVSGAAGACATLACSCYGEYIGGTCNGGFNERFTKNTDCLDDFNGMSSVSNDADGGADKIECNVDHDCVMLGRGCCPCPSWPTPDNRVVTSKAGYYLVAAAQCPDGDSCAKCQEDDPHPGMPVAHPACHDHRCVIVTAPYMPYPRS